MVYTAVLKAVLFRVSVRIWVEVHWININILTILIYKCLDGGMVYTTDLKSVEGVMSSAGSTPAPGTMILKIIYKKLKSSREVI